MFVEPNAQQEAVSLFLKHEEDMFAQIEEENNKVDAAVEEMELLNHFLAYVDKNMTDEGLKVEGEARTLVDELSKRDSLQHIFAKGEYDWNASDSQEMMERVGKLEERYTFVGTSAQNMRRQLTQHLEGPLQRQISHASEVMVMKESKLSEALSMFKNMLTRYDEVKRAILNNERG